MSSGDLGCGGFAQVITANGRSEAMSQTAGFILEGRVEENIDIFDLRYRVRVRRAGRLHTKSFTKLKDARRWRDAIKKALPAPIEGGLRRTPQPNKTSNLPVGVSLTHKRDRRKPDEPVYVAYSVFWQDAQGRKRVKTFQVGRSGEISTAADRRARFTAIAFRACDEWCVRNQTPFHPERFGEWRDLKCYPFKP